MSLVETLWGWFETTSPKKRSLVLRRARSRWSIPAFVQSLEPRALLSGAPSQFVDPHPVAGNNFGASVTLLANGNVVITSPNDDAGGGSTAGGTGAGAVYLFNFQTGALISTVAGSHAGDLIGSGGVTALTNGNYVVDSPDWNGFIGSVTWGNGTSGVTGTINIRNSLVGSSAYDRVGEGGVTVVGNGNYVVNSYDWSGFSGAVSGAVTWGNGATGIVGTVSAANSLVGSSAGDQVGLGGITILTNGNYVVNSNDWNNSTGAVTWGSGATGVKGVVSASNSLVGDSVGNSSSYFGVSSQSFTVLTNGNYVVDNPSWNNNCGAVTFGSGTTGVAGFVSAANSLVGATGGNNGDFVGSYGVTALNNGNYVVDSASWNTGSVASGGAVTWGSGTTGVNGVVSPINSLVGTRQNGPLGGSSLSQDVTALINGNYVVDSPYWNMSTGAVTWGDGTKGVVGTISAANSLIGSKPNDDVGLFQNFNSGVTALTNGNYVVDSPDWNGLIGSVTWGSGTSGVMGTINIRNSLVGSAAYGRVGEGGVTAVGNGNYVVNSYDWNLLSGAVTWGNGTTGLAGTISAVNSLVGSRGDQVGSGSANVPGVTVLSNGNYVVDSPEWNNSGAVTWGSETTGVVGTIDASNSLVGTAAGDSLGLGGVTALSNGNYVVDSYAWNGLGAVTLGSGKTGLTGTVSKTNSLVGSTFEDFVGSGGITALSNGNYVVSSWQFDNQAGAVTFGSGTIGVTGAVNPANSLVGTVSTDQLGLAGITTLGNGSYIVDGVYGNGITGVSGKLSNASKFAGQYTFDNSRGTVYLADGLGHVYRGTAATGFTNLTSNGPSIVVSDYSEAVSNKTGSLSFSTTTLGTPVAQLITITNSGNAPLIVQPVKVPGGFSVLNNFRADQSIASGASASFTLQLDATTTGTQSGVVTIGSNVMTASPFTFTVTGTVTTPKIVVQRGSTHLANGTSTIDFGSTLVGTPVRQIFTVANNGNASLLVTLVTVPTGYSVVNDSITNQSIAVGASASFTLQLDATAIGAPSGMVTIANNDATIGLFTFHITGAVSAPQIVVQQGLIPLVNGTSVVDLGITPVGTSVTQLITVTNTGNAALIVQPVIVPSGFSVLNNFTANESIAAGSNASCTLQLDASVPGNPTGVVMIANSDTTAGPFSFNVTGIIKLPIIVNQIWPVLVVQRGDTSLANGTGPIIFNSNPAGATVSQVFTVTNYGHAPLIVQPVTVPNGYSVLNNFTANESIPASISAIYSVNFTIQLNANAPGTPTGTVTLSSNDPRESLFKFTVVANHPPTAINLSNSVIATNLSSATPVGIFSTTDPDFSVIPQTFVYSVVSPNFQDGTQIAPIFSVVDHGNLTLAASAPKGKYDIQITSTDQGGLSFTQSFTIYVTGPSSGGVGSGETAASDSPSGFTLETFPISNITVQDATGNSNLNTGSRSFKSVIKVVTYRLGVGGDNEDFAIDASGHLQTAVALDVKVKSNYHLTIISSNTITGISTVYPYTITVVPVLKPAIVVTPATFTVAETSPNGTPVGRIAATGLGGQPLTYTIIGGNTNSAFAITRTTGQITVANSAALGLATNSKFSLTVQASDSRSSASATITINLARIWLSNSSVAENAKINTLIGQFTTTEAGASNTCTYSLVPGKADDAGFTIDSSGHLKLNVVLNAAIRNSYTIEVTSTNQDHQSITHAFTITVLGPSNIMLSNSNIAETAKIGTIIGQFSTTDAGTGNTFAYKFVSGKNDNADFTIDSTGHLKLNVALNASIKNSYRIDVVTTDQRGLSLSKLFTITVLGPSNLTLSSSTVAGTAKIGTIIGLFSTTDVGTGNTFTYKFVSGKNDNADFTIDSTGHLRLNVALNKTIRSSYTISVVSTDQRGLSIIKSFTIKVI